MSTVILTNIRTKHEWQVAHAAATDHAVEGQRITLTYDIPTDDGVEEVTLIVECFQGVIHIMKQETPG